VVFYIDTFYFSPLPRLKHFGNLRCREWLGPSLEVWMDYSSILSQTGVDYYDWLIATYTRPRARGRAATISTSFGGLGRSDGDMGDVGYP
jgi:hypothetical protein